MATGAEQPPPHHSATSAAPTNWWAVSAEDNLSSFTNNSHNTSTLTLDSTELGQRSELVESAPFQASMEEAHSACVSVSDSQIWNQVFMNVGNEGNLYPLLSSRREGMEASEHGHQHSNISNNTFAVKTEGVVHDAGPSWSLTNLNSALDGLSAIEKPMDLDPNPLRYSAFPNTTNAGAYNLTDWSLGPPVAVAEQKVTSFHPLELQNSQMDHLMNAQRQKQEQSPFSFGDTTTHMTLNGMPVLQGFKADNFNPRVLEASPGRFFRNTNSCSVLGLTEDYGPMKFHHSNTLKHGTLLGKPLLDFHGGFRPLLGHQPQISPQSRAMGSQCKESNMEAMKKRNGESSSQDAVFKRPRYDTSSSTTSSYKSQAPKVKLGDRITALQQLVSPFGKTDTASVLFDCINYIKYLHEQVQVLSNPYMKAGSSQADHKCWGERERDTYNNNGNSNGNTKEGSCKEPKLDLKSRGLCLVPVSCTLQVSTEISNPDYWQHTLGGSFR